MKLSIIVEGRTETAFKEALSAFLRSRISRMPRLDFLPQDGRIPKAEKLKRLVHNLLQGGSDHVIALTDVYTGTQPPDFNDAADARAKMSQWVGDEPRFHPHAAQHDFEAWLLPYWTTIQKLALHNKAAPPPFGAAPSRGGLSFPLDANWYEPRLKPPSEEEPVFSLSGATNSENKRS